MRARLLWSLAASALLNLIAWVALPAGFAVRSEHGARERLVVATSLVRFERRARIRPTARPSPRPTPHTIAAHTPQPRVRTRRTPRIARATAAPQSAAESEMLGPPPPASIALPASWSRQDLAFLGTTNTAEWLDWSHSKKNDRWVPRIFLWQMQAKTGYMHQPTLDDGVKQILDTLHQDAKMQASRSQRVCDGRRNGWFLSYVKPDDDPPLHFDETIFMVGQKIYRAIYIREVDQPEDLKTRDALNTLCWP
ncbi:MAG TPA: hypothetical protein VJP85_12290 [Candidatus Baltobacteraceae bacterium]|nr:hypothetical protein [Candidatus Baltobacteraceae bacterium]